MRFFHSPMADEERIAAYIDGTLSPGEMNAFDMEMANADDLFSFVSDFKLDLGTIDKGIQLESNELDFDSNSAIDSLFEESNKWPLYSNDDVFDSPIANVEAYLDYSDCYEPEIFHSDSAMNDDADFHIDDDGGVSSPVINDTNDF